MKTPVQEFADFIYAHIERNVFPTKKSINLKLKELLKKEENYQKVKP
jgi:hypothetical protein